MVDHDVLLADGGEAIAAVLAHALRETGGVGRELQVRSVERDEVGEILQRERAVDEEDLVVSDVEHAGDEALQRLGRGMLDLQSNNGTAPATLQRGFEQAHEVFRLLLDFEVGIADHPEGALAVDPITREQAADEQADGILQRDEPCASGFGIVDRQADVAVDLRGHADEGDHLLAARRGEFQHQREAEIGNEGERMRRIDGQRREHREHVGEEIILQPDPLAFRDFIGLHQHDAGGREFHAQPAPLFLLRGLQPPDGLADARKLLARGHAVVAALGDARPELAAQAGHAHHEELVEVVGRDRQEAKPLEDRMIRIGRLLQNAQVELQPRQLAVDEPRRIVAQIDRGGRGLDRRHDLGGIRAVEFHGAFRPDGKRQIGEILIPSV